ncbi:hypothetical protein VHA01S_031_00380 [Vibrio halioticoli NBRC 102217]|uniref:Transposase n=1 Tax=Vibrio halioticoli NBRC 102217 TaxID=1219072 RepID=V5HLF6_9VIBR|nr:hypothetical protein VHA01S_031_00380 [Vibrio halioticoli NBRC 102217]
MTSNICQTGNYLDRYLKRPLNSASRLRYYSKGGMLTFEYLNVDRSSEPEGSPRSY